LAEETPLIEMTVVYAKPHFKPNYDQLPPASQAQFKLIDAQVKAGNLKVLKQNGWIYYASVGGGYIAWGSLKNDDVFLWRDVTIAAKVPAIL
jgi:hypothetical protein